MAYHLLAFEMFERSINEQGMNEISHQESNKLM